MAFDNGNYASTSFNLSRWDASVSFNLFDSLGSQNIALIRNVILFIATLFGAFIIISSGRSKV
ncbi:hypothetical protein VCRA2116O29_990001 [Vibrio crassostreae]|nr:hypothetical protein VCRA2116O29_990001 [Vibrio crassostreae]CAK3897278.1 hypothetical protein VCRA212O16_300049 [Vibrio crassostreae]